MKLRRNSIASMAAILLTRVISKNNAKLTRSTTTSAKRSSGILRKSIAKGTRSSNASTTRIMTIGKEALGGRGGDGTCRPLRLFLESGRESAVVAEKDYLV